MNRPTIFRPRPVLALLAAACAALFLAGCVKAPPMTASEFRWQCNISGMDGSGGGGSNDNDNDGSRAGCDPFYQDHVCQEYSVRLEAFTGGLDECLALCRGLRDQFASERVYYDTCQSTVVEVADVCNRYCRRNFQ